MSSIFNFKRPIVENSPDEKSSSIFTYKPPIQEVEKSAPLEEPKINPLEEEDLQRDIEKTSARTLSRIGERIAGLPGDLQSVIKHFTGIIPGPQFPTSEELKAGSEKITQGYTAPKNQFDEKVDETVGDLASMALPGAGTYGFFRNLGIPVVANLAKEGLERKFGAGDKKADYGKSGLMVVLDLLAHRGKGGAIGYGNRLLKDAEKSIPKGTTTNVSKLKESLNQLEQTLKMGGERESRAPALKRIRQIRSRIKDGQLDPKEFPELRTAINEQIESLGGFKIELPPKIRTRLIKNLNDVKKEVILAGEEYGATQNPQFLKNWQAGNEALAVANKTNHITNFIEKRFGNKLKSVAAKTIFGIGPSGAALGVGGAPGLVASTGITAGLTGIYQGAKILQRVIQSPTLRRYYSNVIQGATSGNVQQVSKNLQALDRKLLEEEEKEKDLIEKYTK